MKDKLTPQEYKDLIKKPKKNKYGAVSKVYKGVKYDSTLEAKYAAKLDLLKRIGEIHDWERQVSIDLNINGQEWRTWKIDFKVWVNLDHHEWHECKGVETIDFQMKRDAFNILYPDEKLIIIKEV